MRYHFVIAFFIEHVNSNIQLSKQRKIYGKSSGDCQERKKRGNFPMIDVGREKLFWVL